MILSDNRSLCIRYRAFFNTELPTEQSTHSALLGFLAHVDGWFGWNLMKLNSGAGKTGIDAVLRLLDLGVRQVAPLCSPWQLPHSSCCQLWQDPLLNFDVAGQDCLDCPQ